MVLWGHPVYLVFAPIPGTELLKPLEFLVKRMGKVSFVMLMMWLSVKPQICKGWRLVARGTNHRIKGLKCSVPLPNLWRGERGWRFSSITKCQWSNQLCLYNGTPIKPQMMGFRKLPGRWAHVDAGRVPLPEDMEALFTFPIPCPVPFFHLAVSEF